MRILPVIAMLQQSGGTFWITDHALAAQDARIIRAVTLLRRGKIIKCRRHVKTFSLLSLLSPGP